MKTLVQHVDALAQHSTDSKDVILQAILGSPFIIDEDSLLCYYVEKYPWANYLTILYESGNGTKIWEWVKKISRENKCEKIYCITQRPKGVCRKYGFRQSGVLCEREGFI
nr:MAG TPA: hypothetical protein [Caudoviricetes sp.]